MPAVASDQASNEADAPVPPPGFVFHPAVRAVEVGEKETDKFGLSVNPNGIESISPG